MDSLNDGSISPIPMASLATSPVNQLEHSPPHPPDAFSPSSFSATNGFKSTKTLDVNSSIDPYSLPEEDAIPSQNSSTRKVHPADLVTPSNPDPHLSPDSTPIDELLEPAYSPAISSTEEDSRDYSHSRKNSEYRVARSEEAGLVSENGAHIGHGSEEYGHEESSGLEPRSTATYAGVSDTLSTSFNSEAQDLPIQSTSRIIPPILDSNSTSNPSTSTSGRSRSEDVTRSSSKSRTSSTGATARQGDRRDREREKEQREATLLKEKERESTRSRRVLGEWSMSKTLGAGSMGKVKLGISSITGEKVRVVEEIGIVVKLIKSLFVRRSLSKLYQDLLQLQLLTDRSQRMDLVTKMDDPHRHEKRKR